MADAEADRARFVAEELRRLFQYWLFRATVFGALLFMFFAVLDLVIAPDYAVGFLVYRVGGALALLAVAALSRRVQRLQILYALGFCALLLAAAIVEIMILALGGQETVYFAGMLVVGVCAVSFIPAPLSFHLPLACSVWLIYLAPPLLTAAIADVPAFFATNFFLVAILATVLTMRSLSHRTLLREIAQRFELDRQRGRLELLVRERTDELSLVVTRLREEIAGRERIQLALKKASDDWRVTFDSTQDLILMSDAAGRAVKVNRATARFFEKPYAELLNREISVLFSDLSVPAGSNPIRSVGESLRHEQGEVFLSRTGRWLSVTADPILDEEGHFQGAVSILRDITSQKSAAEEHRKLENALTQMQKMDSIGRLAGGVSHDFNNILSVVLGYGEITLLKLPEGHPARDSLRVVMESAERAVALTRQLLAFSRKQVLAMKALNLNEVIEQMGRMLLRLIKENVKIELRTERRVQNILADKSQIEQVILNLVVNARDAMPGGGTLTVETADVRPSEALGVEFRGLKPGPYVMLAVRDTGTGMTPEVREKIFEPFFTTKEVGKGTGLGLATVYGIVRQHEGHLAVESVPGQGTTFRAYFPATATAVEKPFSECQAADLRGTERILVVEDDRLLRLMIRDALQPLGYEVVLAADAVEALNCLESGAAPIDLLLTDFVLPGMNGSDLSAAFRSRRPGTKVVIMSGYFDDTQEQQRLQHSGVPFIQKPLVPSKFIRVLRDTLDGKPC
ncbi:MAG: hybrid sensor histidine kinase/response regulator [Candidatus Methylomirabilia bacterium]